MWSLTTLASLTAADVHRDVEAQRTSFLQELNESAGQTRKVTVRQEGVLLTVDVTVGRPTGDETYGIPVTVFPPIDRTVESPVVFVFHGTGGSAT